MNLFTQDTHVKKLSLKNPIHFLALGFGSGLAAKAPGTFGTLAALPVFLLLSFLPVSSYILVTIIVSVVGIYICDKAARDMGVHDHGAIVWDEVAGLLTTLIAVPMQWQWILVGFALFRFFDIIKPWPIKWLDAKVSGGFGIMIDDIVAGIFSLVCLQVVLYFF
ncbi:phosphatidylglycerophosphatase A [Parashewanella spongiae]|uniref:Phosphatidylglycerophosphatase A n=1 Tax=Parashewanella spongiae TaxID=342950 RepID=A0A3A6T2N4_9GAMM|nr:phosphatidylglycerophosphatase A [Parashewanella spongiae]MCL1078843.1 phosphatidylglycerophosphatase A [Parashewanella spongiae]RJY02107.1 phosphatidylglycerophosphatase A [Parashewanella spongiae]